MPADVLWRDSGLTPRLGPIDATAIFPIMLFFLHWAYWTLVLSLVSIVILYLCQRARMSPVTSLRFIKCMLIGKRRECAANETVFRRRCRW